MLALNQKIWLKKKGETSQGKREEEGRRLGLCIFFLERYITLVFCVYQPRSYYSGYGPFFSFPFFFLPLYFSYNEISLLFFSHFKLLFPKRIYTFQYKFAFIMGIFSSKGEEKSFEKSGRLFFSPHSKKKLNGRDFFFFSVKKIFYLGCFMSKVTKHHICFNGRPC